MHSQRKEFFFLFEGRKRRKVFEEKEENTFCKGEGKLKRKRRKIFEE